MPKFPHNVDRRRLREILGLPDKIPKAFQGRFRNVPLESRWPEAYLGVFDVVVRPSGGRQWGHRVYIVCDCGREVPAGRMHQHECK